MQFWNEVVDFKAVIEMTDCRKSGSIGKIRGSGKVRCEGVLENYNGSPSQSILKTTLHFLPIKFIRFIKYYFDPRIIFWDEAWFHLIVT